MNITSQMAKHFRGVYFGGNWTVSNLREHLSDVTWKEATTRVYDLNTIATLVHHLNYYVSTLVKVLRGGPLDAKDKFSFDQPPIQSQADWEAFLDQVWQDGENLAELVEQLPPSKLDETFMNEKYGNYYRNIHGVIEHAHYHLGQIVLIKKILRQK